MPEDTTGAVQIFCCYAPKDKALLNRLEEHLSPLKRRKKIAQWSDHEVKAGMDWEKEVEAHLNVADIVLLLISPSFISSDLCYSVQMQKALERQQKEQAVVVPIILRPTLWKETPLGRLQALPKNSKPITSWHDRDAAFLDVVIEIWSITKKIIERREKGILIAIEDTTNYLAHPFVYERLNSEFLKYLQASEELDKEKLRLQEVIEEYANGIYKGKQVQRVIRPGDSDEDFVSDWRQTLGE